MESHKAYAAIRDQVERMARHKINHVVRHPTFSGVRPQLGRLAVNSIGQYYTARIDNLVSDQLNLVRGNFESNHLNP